MLTRRHFLAYSSAGVTLAVAARALAERNAYTAADYERALVIDAMGTIGDPDPAATLESAPSQRLLSDIRASGVTAVSMTLSVGSNGDRLAKALQRIAVFDEKVAAAPDALMRVRKAADLTTAKSSGRLGLIYNVQDTSLLENDLSRVALLHSLGLRVMQMTYNVRNLVGDGCLERANAGLSNLGRALVAELGRVGMVMDLSHAGQRTIAEAIAEAKSPTGHQPHWLPRSAGPSAQRLRRRAARTCCQGRGSGHLLHAIPRGARRRAQRGSDPAHRTRRERMRRGPCRPRHRRHALGNCDR